MKRVILEIKENYYKMFFLLIVFLMFIFAINRSYDRFIVPSSETEKITYSVSEVSDEEIMKIAKGNLYFQSFFVDKNGLSTISVKLKELDVQQGDIVAFQLVDMEKDEIVDTWSIESQIFSDEEYYILELNREIKGVNNKEYLLYLTIIAHDELIPNDIRDIEQEMCNLDQKFLFALQGTDYTFILQYYKIFASMLIIISGIILGIVIFKNKICIEKIALATIILFGILYAIVYPPFTAPDEYVHFIASYELSNKMMGIEEDENIEKQMPDVYGNDGYFNRYARLTSYKCLVDSLNQHDKTAESKLAYEYNPIDYAGHYVQAIGITGARLLDANYVGIIYIGRFVNLLFFAIMVHFAIRIAPIGKLCIFAVSMLPMSLELAASISYDAYINGLSFFFIAYVLSLIYDTKEIKSKNIVICIALLVLLFPCKYIYILFLFLLLLIPIKRISYPNKVKIVIITAIFICCCTIKLVTMLYTPVVNDNVKKETDTSVDYYEATVMRDDQLYTMRDILSNPLNSINVIANTLRDYGTGWIEGLAGKYLGSLDINITGALIYAFYVLIFMASIKQETESNVDIALIHRCVYIGTFLMIFFSGMLAMFVGWTPNTSSVILGVQGRYFLPAFPLVGLSMKTEALTFKKNVDKIVINGSVILSFFVLLYSFEQIVQMV